MGRRFAAQDVHVSAESGLRIDRRRSAGRRATEKIPHRSREQGPGLRLRAVALVWRVLLRLAVAHQHVVSAATATGSGHMSFVARIIGTAERVPLPDVVIRAAIQRLCSRTATRLASGDAERDASFADEIAARAIAEHTDEATAQHYEVPAAFFAHVLGPNRKYSSCYYKEPESTLQEAEEESLRQTVEHADLHDGQSILELGCGWGSLSLWMARQFPHSQVSAVSNANAQREYIEGEAAKRGLTNLHVITSDVDLFAPEARYDRIVSIEMFEHMMNWRELM